MNYHLIVAIIATVAHFINPVPNSAMWSVWVMALIAFVLNFSKYSFGRVGGSNSASIGVARLLSDPDMGLWTDPNLKEYSEDFGKAPTKVLADHLGAVVTRVTHRNTVYIMIFSVENFQAFLDWYEVISTDPVNSPFEDEWAVNDKQKKIQHTKNTPNAVYTLYDDYENDVFTVRAMYVPSSEFTGGQNLFLTPEEEKKDKSFVAYVNKRKESKRPNTPIKFKLDYIEQDAIDKLRTIFYPQDNRVKLDTQKDDLFSEGYIVT